MPIPRIAVLGDSVPSRYGLPNARCAYPLLLEAALAPQPAVVRSFAKGGVTLGASLEGLGRVTAFRPDVVVMHHGGRESLMRPGLVLRALASHPDDDYTGRSLPRLRRLRQRVYGRMLNAVATGRHRRALRALGVRPIERAEDFETAFAAALSEIGPDADVVFVVPHHLRMTVFPWDPPNHEAVRETILRAAASALAVIDLADFGPADFQRDGVHLSEAGHRRMADAIADAIRDRGEDADSP